MEQKRIIINKSCHISLKFSVLYCIGMKEETLCGLCTPIENKKLDTETEIHCTCP